MNAVLTALNVVGAAAFVIGLVLALRLPSTRASRGLKALLIATGLACLFIAVSNVVEHGFGYVVLDRVEDYMEVVFVPSLAYTAYALNMHASHRREKRAAELASSECELLLQILDLSPVGIMVVDDHGKVTFASEGARAALELEESPDGFARHYWRLLDDRGKEIEDGFGGLCHDGEAHEDIHLQLAWPDGLRSRLLVSAAPMADRTGRASASVIALEDVQRRIAVLSS